LIDPSHKGHFDVVVVGCGPVGALAASLLGRAGLKTLIIDQAREPYPLPRAVHLDHEAMRILQGAGLIDRVGPGMREGEGHLHIGADQGVIRYLGAAGLPKPFGWANDYFFYQPEFEAELRGALRDYPQVSVRLGVAFDALTQDEDGVTLELKGEGGVEQVRARWVIACDGARSAVRKHLNVALDDLDFEEPWLVVDVEVDGPVHVERFKAVPAEADPQKMAITVCDPVRPTTTVPGRGRHRRWEFMLLPGEDDEEMMRPERIYALLDPWVSGVPHRLVRAATYRFHGLIAERWQVGRVFLAGDAAHQTPPFFGQGMCHGMRDVANLAWKLDLVERGVCSKDLLNTYQPERDAHVRQIISASVEAGRYICVLDPAAAAVRDRRMRAPVQGAARTAADLVPPIREGVILKGSPGAGERFIQPWVMSEGGRQLLDAQGGGWRLVVRDAATATAARAAADAVLSGLDLQVIQADALADGGALSVWLADRGAAAAVVRPDYYVFGTSGAEGLGSMLESLSRALCSRH
jgi:3-(3-hydroxy-phenyl)propionate hydroxylase